MILNSRIFGKSEKKLIILHGFLGSLDNWITIAKKFSDQLLEVHVIDQRNHGKSFHSDEFSYELMALDIKNYINYHNLNKVSIIGHSMGGKTACCFALNNQHLIEKLIVVDILPILYNNDYDLIFEALNSIELNSINKRSDFEDHLKKFFENELFISFLSKNLIRTKNSTFTFKFNLKSLMINIDQVLKKIDSTNSFESEIFFIKGGNSDYITDEGLENSTTLFKNYSLTSIKDSGHWLHYDKPKEFFKVCLEILSI